MPTQRITLENLAGGAAEELFQDALRKVLENVADVNTDHKAKREIVLRFVFKVDEERNIGQVVLQPSVTLAGVKGVPIVIYLGKDQGVPVAVEAPRQAEMFPHPESRPRPVVTEQEVDKVAAAMKLRRADGSVVS